MKNIIEEIKDFLLASAEYCLILENIEEHSIFDFVSKLQKILPLIYLKTSLLPNYEDINDNEVEKFVQEADWEYIRNKIVAKLGEKESFIDIYTPETYESTEVDNASLSECITDVYQDLKDFTTLVQLGNKENVKAAITELKYNFEFFWGSRLIAALSVLHNLIYSGNLENEIESSNNFGNSDDLGNINTSNWIINQHFKDNE